MKIDLLLRSMWYFTLGPSSYNDTLFSEIFFDVIIIIDFNHLI